MEKFTFDSTTNYHTKAGNSVTYYEIEFPFTGRNRMNVASAVNGMIKLEEKFSAPLNEMDFSDVIVEAKKLQEQALIDLPKYRGSLQMRHWQPEKLFSEFRSIFKVKGSAGKLYFFTREFNRVPLPLIVQNQVSHAHDVWLVVGMTTEWKLKCYVVVEHIGEML